MRAIYIEAFRPEDPVAAILIGDRPEPEATAGWTVVKVHSACLNHHDLWSARGLGLREDRLPMILGCDAAGTDPEGNPVIIHSVVTDPAWLGAEELDPKLSLLSELHQGTLAEKVVVPKRNLVPKPAMLSFEDAACLPTAWLTAYRILFTQALVHPGDTVLVQGSSGGLSTACIALGAAAGLRVWATGRTAEKRAYAEELGADATFNVGARLPERVDAVIDSIGAATWQHSLRSLAKGGTMIVSGGTSGFAAEADVARIFHNNLRIQGSTMGTRHELERLAAFLIKTGMRPAIDVILPLEDAIEGFAKLANGTVRGKVVIRP